MNPFIFFLVMCLFFHFFELFAPNKHRSEISEIKKTEISIVYSGIKDKMMSMINIALVTITVLEIFFYGYLAYSYPWLPIQILAGIFSLKQLIRLFFSKRTKNEVESCETYNEFEKLSAKKKKERNNNHRKKVVNTFFHCLSIIFYSTVIMIALSSL